MPSLPGSKLWSSALVGYTAVTDWDYNNGGTVVFDDGTLWSYEAESPASGDQDQGDYPTFWLNISERKPGSDVWERLVPDTWGTPQYDNPPNHPLWPTFYTRGDSSYVDWLDPLKSDFSGPLNVAHIGNQGTNWRHVQNGDDVWFYAGDEAFGPVRVNRHTRTWERYITDVASQGLWGRIHSNMVIDGEYMWFMAYPSYTCTGYNDKGLSLCRARVDDPNDVVVVKEWDDPDGWDSGVNTSNITLPDFLDNQYIVRGNSVNIEVDNGYLYFFTPRASYLLDSRSVDASSSGTPSARNWNMKYSMLRRCLIGDYTLETLLWHTSPQGWVGIGATSGYGTLLDATVGVTNQEDHSNTRDNNYEAIGMGMKCSGEHELHVNNGWLYWVDGLDSPRDPETICRVDLSKLDPLTPVQHDPLAPIFEVITNGTAPWEGDLGHFGNAVGTRIWYRSGAQPILPRMDMTFTFHPDGSIYWKGMAFPNYYSDEFGYGTRLIERLTPPDVITQVIVSFVGDELQGYGNIREVPMTRETLEVVLS